MELITVIFIIGIISVYALWRNVNTEKKASILTTIGVLGTFVGVCIGLYNFDVTNIEGSIPPLLDGLKTAFITSIVGMFFSIICKRFPNIKTTSKKIDGATIDTLANLLNNIKDELKITKDEQKSSNVQLIKALTGEGETTLVTQLQKLRTSTQDGFSDLRNAFTAFAEDTLANLNDIKDELKITKDEQKSSNAQLIKALTGEGETTLVTQLQKLRTSTQDGFSDLRNAFTAFAEYTLANLLSDIKYELKITKDEQKNSNAQLIKALTGEGETTLVTQLQKLRTSTQDGFSDLRNAFTAFADKIAEDNTAALIEALENVMRDFNTKINEQFGENFKHLNEGVGKMLEWQDNYKEQVETAADLLKKSSESIQKVDESMTQIAGASGELVTAGKTTQAFITQATEGLAGFKELGDRAKDAMPQITEHIERLTNLFAEKVIVAAQEIENQTKNLSSNQEKMQSVLQEVTKSAMTEIKQNIENLTEGFTENIENTIKQIENQTKKLSSNQEKMQSVLEEVTKNAMTKIKQNIEDLTEGFTENVENTIKQIENQTKNLSGTQSQMNEVLENIDGQIKNLDNALRKELEDALNQLGNQLATLSGKFVEDYQPLTENLRKVVRLAEDIEKNR